MSKELFDMQSVTLILAAVVAVHGLPLDDAQSHGVLNRRLMNGLGKTPALGWNSWVCFMKDCSIELSYYCGM